MIKYLGVLAAVLAVGAAFGAVFGEPGTRVSMALLLWLVLVLPVAFLGEQRDTRQLLRTFLKA
jgi:hypothetical protein